MVTVVLVLGFIPNNERRAAAATTASILPGYAISIEAGDTLERLAQYYLGSQSFSSAILVATNEVSDFSPQVQFIPDPYALQVGHSVWIPTTPTAIVLRGEYDAYEQGVHAASLLRSLHRAFPLLAIPADSSSVQVVTWIRSNTDIKASQPVPYSLKTEKDFWVTIVPVLQEFCKKLHLQDPTLRLEQLLGLPPGSGDTLFVEMRVPLDSAKMDIFRPCLDPQIDTSSCPVDVPPKSSPPWYPAWFYHQYYASYGGTPYQYPWTALGYTYDWGTSLTHVGESEYVIPAGATIQVESITPTAEYCAAPS